MTLSQPIRPKPLALAAIAAAAMALLSPNPSHADSPAACVRTETACARWIAIGKAPARSMVFATYELDAPNPAIRRALIMVHGTLRNADHYFATATSAAFLAGALDDTIVIAPRFASSDKGCDDTLQPSEIGWSCHGDSWRSGGSSTTNPGSASFDLIDSLLRRLSDKRLFPNLTTIVVAGHSAGGQFVVRYAMANRVHERLDAKVSYVVANPSSYAWPDASRPVPSGDGAPSAASKAWQSETAHTAFTYGPYSGAAAKDYDAWPYGLAHRTGGYTAGVSDEQLRRQLATRPITYLFGQVDVLPLGGFDDSPEAMAQGPTRRAWGEAFVNYIDSRLGAHARAIIVPECGHNDRCVFTTDIVAPLLFPRVEAR